MSISDLITEERLEKLHNFEQKYNLNFSDINLLNQAFCHTSYTNENNLGAENSYERLEFLGDAVLKLSISSLFYNNFQNYQEGNLTKLRAEIVSDKNISNYARKLGFEDLILLGKSERKLGGAKKESILACAFEAFLGAIYIEYKEEGYNKALNFLIENFRDEIFSMDEKINFLNPKAILQEYTQGISKELPIYNLVKEEGKEHKKTFYVEVSYKNEVIGKGSAKNIKEASQNAALDALTQLGILK